MKQEMITVTLSQLAAAVYSGAYLRFSQIRKTISAGHRNRKMPKAVLEEVRSFEDRRDVIVKQYEGKENATRDGYVWPADKREEASRLMDELLIQSIELPGCKIRTADLLDGGLLESDYELLHPWLSE